MRSGLIKLVVGAALLVGILYGAQVNRAGAAVGATIENYYSVCKGGVDGKVSTWHGKNRDGKPPYDPDRRTYDFRCPEEEIYTPAAGKVYGTTPKYGGVVLIEDSVNQVCMVFLGMKTIALEPGQEVEAGEFVGMYRIFHFTAVDGNCKQANWYDVAARGRERPIKFIEFGEVIAPDIRRPNFYEFRSQNPTKEAASVKLEVEIDLKALYNDYSESDVADDVLALDTDEDWCGR